MGFRVLRLCSFDLVGLVSSAPVSLLSFSVFVHEGVEALGGLWERWLFRLFRLVMLISCISIIPFNPSEIDHIYNRH